MMEDAASYVRISVDAVYREESRRILATLIRLLGDFDLAERLYSVRVMKELMRMHKIDIKRLKQAYEKAA